MHPIRIPLIIFEPGRRTREDIYLPTSAIDLLPTLLYVTGQQSAKWSEGSVLPPFNKNYSNEVENIYVLEAQKNKKYEPLTISTVALIKDTYKLMYFEGYEKLGGKNSELVELYDLRNDPEELINIYSAKRETSAELLNELKTKLTEVNKPFLT